VPAAEPVSHATVPISSQLAVRPAHGSDVGLRQAVRSSATPEKLRRSIGNIRSYLVDLEGKLRVGPTNTWQMKASAARYTIREINSDVDVLTGGKLNVGDLRFQLRLLSDSIDTANEANWNRIVADGRSTILELGSALSELEKKVE